MLVFKLERIICTFINGFLTLIIAMSEWYGKPHDDKYQEIMNSWVMREALRYVTSPLILRKFQTLDFCCTKCIVKYRAMIRSEIKTEAIACN
jgi:hypothetical protein